MRVAKLFAVLPVFVLAVVVNSVGSVASQETPDTDTPAPSEVSLSDFAIHDNVPPPVMLRLDDADRCLGSECNGTDPIATGCEADAYTQGPAIPVVGDKGTPIGMLELRGSHNKCDSTQWAQVSQLSQPVTFALRVRQCETGLATEWRIYTEYDRKAQSAQLSSPELCVWPEFAIQDDNVEGGFRVIAVGWPA